MRGGRRSKPCILGWRGSRNARRFAQSESARHRDVVGTKISLRGPPGEPLGCQPIGWWLGTRPTRSRDSFEGRCSGSRFVVAEAKGDFEVLGSTTSREAGVQRSVTQQRLICRRSIGRGSAGRNRQVGSVEAGCESTCNGEQLKDDRELS
jgi:hypothetical protein